MLLSARFAFVSPTGALVRCGKRSSYVVDGGYYENSGLLTLIQIWARLEPYVREYNRSHTSQPIAVWMMSVDNAYRDSANAQTSRRPIEMLAPLRAKGNNNRLIDQEPLEQMAAGLVRSRPVLDCNQRAPLIAS